MKNNVPLFVGLFVLASGFGFILPILAKVLKHGFMTKVDVGFYTVGVVLVLESGRMIFTKARRLRGALSVP